MRQDFSTLPEDDDADVPLDEVASESGSDRPPPDVEREPARNLSVRESILAAIKEAQEKQGVSPAEKSQKTPDEKSGAAVPGQQTGEDGSTPPQRAGGQATSGPPDAWKSKELQSLWSGLAPDVRNAIIKRESDMAKGVEKLKSQHRELEDAIRPFDDTIRRFGFSRAQAVSELFKWQMALAGPHKVEAFRHLMRSHGVDPATVASAATSAPAGGGLTGISPELNAMLSSIVNRLERYDQQSAAQTAAAAQSMVMSWAKDKPHFEKVRGLMKQLIESGVVRTLESGHPDLDDAYDRAIYADPEVRAIVLAEDRAKRTAENRAAADRARKAGASMRVGSPTGGTIGNTARVPKNESVRDSIRRALAELR